MKYFICIVFLFLASCGGNSHNLALGTLERDRIAHTATANEVVLELPIEQGSIVKKGDVLVKLDDSLQKTKVNKATAEVAQAQANFEKLKNGARAEEIEIAKAKVIGTKALLVELEANFGRSKNMFERNVISKSDFDTALASRDSGVANLQIATEQLREITNGTREEDLRIAEANLKSAIATLDNEKKTLDNLTIIATRDGILDSLPWNLGERVTIGSPLAIVLADKAPYARVYIPEPYRVKMKVGGELIIHVDGLNKEIKGKLIWIATEPAFTPYYALNQEERSRLMYLAKVQLPDSEIKLPNGVPAQVELP